MQTPYCCRICVLIDLAFARQTLPVIQTGPEEWAEFLHMPGKMFTNFNEVRDEIVRDTNAKTGGDKGAKVHTPDGAFPSGV